MNPFFAMSVTFALLHVHLVGTNMYGHKLSTFLGIAPNGKTTILAWCTLESETVDNFLWVFRAFAKRSAFMHVPRGLPGARTHMFNESWLSMRTYGSQGSKMNFCTMQTTWVRAPSG